MSGKTEKKIRKLYTKDMRREAESIGKMIGNHLRKRPRFVPQKVWMWMVRIVIKTD